MDTIVILTLMVQETSRAVGLERCNLFRILTAQFIDFRMQITLHMYNLCRSVFDSTLDNFFYYR